MRRYKAIIFDIDNTLLDTIEMNVYPLMRIIKEEQPNILSQEFDNLCTMHLSMRESRAEALLGKLRKVEGAAILE